MDSLLDERTRLVYIIDTLNNRPENVTMIGNTLAGVVIIAGMTVDICTGLVMIGPVTSITSVIGAGITNIATSISTAQVKSYKTIISTHRLRISEIDLKISSGNV